MISVLGMVLELLRVDGKMKMLVYDDIWEVQIERILYEAAGNVRVLREYLKEELEEGRVDWEDG
jgi:hypothetical protein